MQTRDQPYLPGRGHDWLKVKCIQREEFVIGGYTEPGGARHGFGALLVGYHERGSRRLLYAGKVGTGYSDRTLTELLKKCGPWNRISRPLTISRGASVRCGTPIGSSRCWSARSNSANGRAMARLRHLRSSGCCEDKTAAEVVRDRALKVAEAVAESGQQSPKKPRAAAKPKPKSRQPSGKEPPSHLRREGEASRSTGRSTSSRSADKLFEGMQARLTHPDKVLYAEEGITKLDLARYYSQVGSRMLPHLKDRPLVLVRCPEGQHGECFYQNTPARARSTPCAA